MSHRLRQHKVRMFKWGSSNNLECEDRYFDSYQDAFKFASMVSHYTHKYNVKMYDPDGILLEQFDITPTDESYA